MRGEERTAKFISPAQGNPMKSGLPPRMGSWLASRKVSALRFDVPQNRLNDHPHPVVIH